ncbi:MAG: cytochrome C oxidase subunit II [Bacillota bacterium]
MSSFSPPERIYWKPLGRDEKKWVYFGIGWCLVLFVMMYAWMGIGRQQTPIESYRVDPQVFREQAESFISAQKVDEINGVPVITPNEKGEVYMIARAYQWTPVIKLKKGQTARIYLSSIDFQHGMSIQPLNLNFQVLPGYVYVVHLTPTEAGEFPIICNEYCGLGHHNMSGRIIVTD